MKRKYQFIKNQKARMKKDRPNTLLHTYAMGKAVKEGTIDKDKNKVHVVLSQEDLGKLMPLSKCMADKNRTEASSKNKLPQGFFSRKTTPSKNNSTICVTIPDSWLPHMNKINKK